MKWVVLCLAAIATATATAAAAVLPVKIDRSGKALEFTYAWPAQAAAVRRLDQRFRADAAKEYRRALALARLDQKQYRDQGRASVRDFHLRTWTTAGQTRRLLSLQGQLSTYTGGAHPNTGYHALLWDRKLGRTMNMSALFARPGDLTSLTRAAYCKALDKERLKRRQGVAVALAEFDECPKYSELAISPVDGDKDGRFDALDLVASPYGAGPYVEGAYSIRLPVARRLIAALKPQYRASFEAQRQ